MKPQTTDLEMTTKKTTTTRKTKQPAAPLVKPVKVEPIVAYKAFNEDFACSNDGVPFQYEIGKTYKHEGAVKICSSGFHSCLSPLDTLNYYNLCESRFAIVETGGAIDKNEGGDTKIASAEITIKAELTLSEFIKHAIKWVIKACSIDKEEQCFAQLGSSGDYAKLASSGNYAQLGSSGDSAQLASSGDYAKLASSGDYGRLASSGVSAIVCSAGLNCMAKAGKKGAIALASWDTKENRFRISVAYVGENGIKPDVWYRLNERGEFFEVEK